MKKIGFIVNPVAGIGGKVGLKGSDGTQTLKKALELGAVPEAGAKALGTMKLLKPMEQQLEIHTCPGNMGEDICKQAGLNYRLAEGTKAWSQCSPSSRNTTPKDTMDAAGMLCNEVGELAVNDVGNGDLLIAGAGHDLNTGAFNQTSGRIHYRQTGVLAAEVHEVDNGLPDDIVQGHQNGQGQKAPQAAAHGIEALFLVELLHLLLHLQLVVGVFLLDLLHLAGHAAHPHHALLGLHLEG